MDLLLTIITIQRSVQLIKQFKLKTETQTIVVITVGFTTVPVRKCTVCTLVARCLQQCSVNMKTQQIPICSNNCNLAVYTTKCNYTVKHCTVLLHVKQSK